MSKINIAPGDQKTVIAKFRTVAAAIPGVTYTHERLRRTKTRAETNTHSLAVNGETVASLTSGIVGLAVWSPNLTARLRGNR